MCDCNSNTQCNCGNINNQCECEYLKPLCIKNLFDDDNCTSYKDVLEKSKKARNAFFAAKTSVYNYVNECDAIADSLQSDLSDNSVELDSVKSSYLSTLNNLSSSLYNSLKGVYEGKNIINIDLAKVNEGSAQRPQKSTDIRLVTENNCEPLTLAYIPGVTIQLNKDSKMLKIKLSEPEYMSGLNKHGINRRERDITTTYIVAPSISCNTSYNLYVEEPTNPHMCDNGGHYNIDLNDEEDVFQNLDIARDFFEEIQNYQDNYIIDARSTYGNQLLEVMNYLDKTITRIENTHKYVVQLCKINK